MKARTINVQRLIAAYGLTDEKLGALAVVCDKGGITLREVGAHEADCTVGYLCGEGGALPSELSGEAPKAECLIFSGFGRRDLSDTVDALRQVGARAELKAICTPSNRSWTLRALLTELEKEHAYMAKNGGAK